MKNYRWYIILIVLGLCVSNNTQAQNTRRYERKDFTFKVTKETNADGEVNIVNLSTYAGEQLINKYSYNVPYPLSENLSETIGLISEEDINREFGSLKSIRDNHPKYVVSMDHASGLTNIDGIRHYHLRDFLCIEQL